MTDEQKAAYVHANASAALIEALAMYTENTERLQQGKALAYGEEQIYGLIGSYGLHHNAMLELFHH